MVRHALVQIYVLEGNVDVQKEHYAGLQVCLCKFSDVKFLLCARLRLLLSDSKLH